MDQPKNIQQKSADANFILKGHIVFTPTPAELVCLPNHYLICQAGCVAGLMAELPQEVADLPFYDMGDQIILPGMSDLHVHAAQYAYRGLGMDLELLDG